MKIVFFVNVIRQARCIRRIEDFINRGYEVEVYGFDRDGDNRKLPDFQYEILGKVSAKSSYKQRMLDMKKAISNVINRQNDNNIVYFLFNLDVAIAYILAGGWSKRYIYEVSDLMELGVENKFISRVLILVNKMLVKKSLETIMTSEGFLRFLFGSNKLQNVTIIPNKLNRRCLDLPFPQTKDVDINHLTIGFTGAIRGKSIYDFLHVIGEKYPHINMQLHGTFVDDKVYGAKIKSLVEKFTNINYYGVFKNPDDFPNIYSNIDMTLCLYGNTGNNKVLEPNKLYEAIFYEKPLIVSEGSFVGDKVKELGVGFILKDSNEDTICNFINNLSLDVYNNVLDSCRKIKKELLVDDTNELFEKLSIKLNYK